MGIITYGYFFTISANAKVAGKSEGPKLTLKVMAGDTISISAQAFYNIDRTLPGQGADIVPVVGSAIAALAGGAMVPAGEAASLALDMGATASTSAALSQLPQDRQEDEGTQPESGLHFVLYNEQMDVVEANTGILPVDDRINRIQDLSSDQIVIQESGYLEVYVNNEAQTPVYYDNLVVMQSTGNVIEVNAYYPYGKIIQGLSTSSTYGKNNYKYSAKELQTELGLNWGDHGARMADYTVGRWWVPDPLAEKYPWLSPFAYCANNPINFIDPDGLTHYSLDSLGHVQVMTDADGNILGKDDKFDMLFAGNNSLKVNDQSILSGLTTKRDNYNGSYSITGEQKDVFNVFVFASDNSKAEWGLSGFTSKEGSSYVISTSHDKESVMPATSITGLDFNTVENMDFKIHSHPNSKDYNFASHDDMQNAIGIANRFYDRNTQTYTLPVPKHYIYHTESKSVIEYTPWNRQIPRGKIQTGVGLRRKAGLIR